MKTNKIILTAAAGLMLGASAHATDIVLQCSGSTAFRSAVLGLVGGGAFPSTSYNTNNPFDSGSVTYVGDSAGKAIPGITLRGTMTKAGLSASQYVQLRFNFTGSANGISDVVNAHALPFHTWDGTTHGTNSSAPDCAFADTYSDSNPTPIDPTTLDDSIIGAPVFAFIRSLDTFAGCTVSGITNITRQQYADLVTDNGPSGMPATYLGGSSSSPVYLIGRDGGSGTRITNDRNVGNTAGQTLWWYGGISGVNYNSNGVVLASSAVPASYTAMPVQTDGNTRGVGPGFLSGGDVGTTVSHTPSSIGYVGLSDNKGAQILMFNGTGLFGVDSSGSVTAPLARLAETGAYEYWSYEHLYNNTSLDGNANQVAVRNALIAGIKAPTYQSTSVYANNNAELANFTVDRGGDGGLITRGSASGIKY